MGHVSVKVVAGLNKDVAVGGKGYSNLTINKLVITQVVAVFVASVISTVDISDQIVVTDITTSGASGTHIFVTQSIGRISRVGIATVATGVGGVATSSTGGRGNADGVIMSGGRDRFGVAVGALRAGISSHTGCGTSGRSSYLAGITVTSGIGVVVFIAVPTGRAGMGRITLSCAGRSGYFAGIAVTQLTNGFCIAVRASGAGIGAYTIAGTGCGSGYLGSVAVPKGAAAGFTTGGARLGLCAVCTVPAVTG